MLSMEFASIMVIALDETRIILSMESAAIMVIALAKVSSMEE